MKRIMTPALAATLACIIFSGPAAADLELENWKFLKDIRATESIESEHAFFEVDAETYDGSAGALRSLRIVDGGAREVPYQVVTKERSEKREEFFPKLLNNSYLNGKYNSFVLDFGDERQPVNEFSIMTASKNFTRRTSVEGGADQSEWNVLAEDTYIYDFSRNVRSSYLRIKFPLSDFRYFRVKVHDDGGGPLDIGGAKTYRVISKPAETESWPLAILERTENEKEKTTEVVLDAGYRGLPIRRIDLDVASRNYHRNIRIESSEDREKWIALGSGVIFNYDMPAFKKTSSRVSFRENTGGRYFKITVENFDDQPIQITRVSGFGLARRVVLSLTGERPYKLCFGNPESRAPRYDLSHRMRYIDTRELPRLALGPRLKNASYSKTKPVRPWSEEHAGLLWVVMGAVIAFLGLLIISLMRKTPPGKTQE